MENKIKDGIIGFAIGDALGVPGEFITREELKKNPIISMTEGGVHKQPIGSFSDDTSMTLATIDSIIENKKIVPEDIAQKFVNWFRKAEYTATNKTFDIGDTTRQAIAKYELNIDIAIKCGGVGEYDNGNGSLMRMLPIAYYIYYTQVKNENNIYQIVRDISSITHAHEISILGCYIYIKYCMFILSGMDKMEAYNKIKEQDYNMFSPDSLSKYDRILNSDISLLSENKVFSNGYVVHTLEAVFWLFLNSKDYNKTILKAVNLGEDSDTVAAITGSLLGIYYGLDSIRDEWKLSLKRYDYIINLCSNFENILRTK